MAQGSRPLPAGWRWVRLGDLANADDAFADGPFGSNLKTEHYTATGVRVIRLQNIGIGRFLGSDEVFVSHEHFERLRRHSVQVGDVVVASLGDGSRPAGRACLVPEGIGPALVKADCFRVRLPGDAILPEYLVGFLNSPLALSGAADRMRGATRPRMNLAMLKATWMPFAPLDQQRGIVRRVADQLAAVERARVAADAQLDALNGLLAFALEEVFESTTAKRWPHLVLGSVAETCSGTTPPRSRPDYYVGEIPWIKTGELKDGNVSESEEHVSDAALRETSLRLLPPGTLLVAMYGQGQTRGRTGLLTTKATTNQACFAVLPSDRIEGRFLQWWFRHNYTRIRQETTARGGSQPNLSGTYLRSQSVPLPPPTEQREIAQTLAEKEMAVLRLSAVVQAEIAAIKALPAALLRRAFSGEP